MQRAPQSDEQLTLLTDTREASAICVEASDDPEHPGGGLLLRVMTHGDFEQGQQCWIVDTDGTKTGAIVRSVSQMTVDTELLLATTLG